MAILSSYVSGNLASALQGIADVLGVPLILADGEGRHLSDWQFPADAPMERQRSFRADWAIPQQPINFDEAGHVAVVNVDLRRRCFAISLGEIGGLRVYVHSGVLRDAFAWTDGTLKRQDFPGCESVMTADPKFLMGLFVVTVCHVVAEKGTTQELDDLDVENIRRVGISCRKRIDCPQDSHDPGPVSLEGVPDLAHFFMHTPTASSLSSAHDLSAAFNAFGRQCDSPVACSFNLMSLSGDFLVRISNVCGICRECIRRQYGEQCFASDLRCLIQAALSKRQDTAFAVRCHAGFLEVFAPVFVQRLIVGLVFGGQIVTSERELQEIKAKYCGEIGKETEFYLVDEEHVGVVKSIVLVFSNLIGRLSDEHCIDRNQAHILEQLVKASASDARSIFAEACAVVKQLLAVSECSAFGLTRNNTLVLEATTAREIKVRDQAKGSIQRVLRAEQAIGNISYRVGEGLTGSSLEREESTYERNAEQCNGWFGKCVEGKEPAQVFLTPIRYGTRSYGVLRAVKPSRLDEIPQAFRTLIELVAGHVGILLYNRELIGRQTDELRETAGRLQDLLAEVAHEYRSPLNNLLSLSTAIPFAQNADEIKVIHQEIKEEVFRAKRNVDNYLLHGLEGRAHQQYDMRLNSLNELVRQVSSRFTRMAARKGLRIVVHLPMFEMIRFDKDRIDQLLSNLLDNAIKYAFNDFEGRCGILISGKIKASTLTVSVRDMGLGIPPEARKSIFEGYNRSVEDPRFFKPGTGLGLRIARKIADAHKGSISVESIPYWSDPRRLEINEGYWTTFTLSLPKDVTENAHHEDAISRR